MEVRHVDELDGERSQHQTVARLDGLELGLVQHFVLFQTPFDQRQSERGAVDGNVQLGEQKRDAADVVFVPVRQDQATHVLRVLLQVREIGRDDVHAHQFGVREHHARVDDDDVVAITEGH